MESGSPHKSPSKPPLITPSASPPPTASLYTNRLSDSVSPLKRQLVSSTPHRTFRERSSSHSSRTPSLLDIDRSRAESAQRLLDVWAGLAYRYTKRLDEDDIVDIMTGDIIKDNGVLRNSRKVDFGGIVGPISEELTGDEGSDGEEGPEEDEYDLDELDSFAHNEAVESEPDDQAIVMLPVNVSDPTDANDLRDFMEAERMRKELCGDDEEEESTYLWEVSSNPAESQDDEASGLTDTEDGPPEALSQATEEDPDDEPQTQLSDHSIIVLDSEDELDNWDPDEANVIYPIVKTEDEYEDDVQIIEPPLPPPPSSPTKSSKRSLQKSTALPHPNTYLNTSPPSPLLSTTVFDETSDDNGSKPAPKPPIKVGPPRASSRSPHKLPSKAKDASISKSQPSQHRPRKDHLVQVEPMKSPKKTQTSTYRQGPLVKPVVLVTPRHLIHSPTSTSPTKSAKGKAKEVLAADSESESYDRIRPSPSVSKKESKPKSSTSSSRSRTTRDKDANEGSISQKSPQITGPSKVSKKRKRRLSDDDAKSGTDDLGTELPNGRTHSSKLSRKSQLQDHEGDAKYPSSGRRHRRRRSPPSGYATSDSSGSSGSSSRQPQSRRSQSRSRYSSAPENKHFPFPPMPQPSHHHPMFAPIPDPRAQFIITQAMQQLSALVSSPWTPGMHADIPIPYTPTHHHYGKSPRPIYTTPTHHPHPYPYTYDPDFSHATLPPDSPDPSSPVKPSKAHRRALVKRSRSRGRRVSFQVEEAENSDELDVFSSPSKRQEEKTHVKRASTRRKTPKRTEKGASASSGSEDSASEQSDAEQRKQPFVRGQTPGPSSR